MTKSKFEQLIEYVINDEEQKARELFHDIVVEKSRNIYENLMNEEDEVEKDDKAEKAGKKVAKDIEYDEKHERTDEDMEDCADDVEVDEEGMMEEEDEESDSEEAEDDADAEFDDEAEEAGEEETDEIEDMGDEAAAGGDMEDRVVDLEDKLDELMAEFESLMGDEDMGDGEEMAGDEEMIAVDDEVGGDAMAQDDTEEFTDVPMAEGISLKAVAKPSGGDNGSNAKSPVAQNSGARGAMAQPVKNTTTESNPDGTSAYKAPSAYTTKGEGNLPGAGNFKNVPGKDGGKQSPAPKPTTAQAAGVNARTPFPKV
jgi:hypothetical protein